MTKTQKGKFGNNLGYATKYNSTFKNFVNGKKWCNNIMIFLVFYW